jgi:uncharacterized protein YyaL (SSP411 family)
MNRLASSGSPYLRQHAGNPVDWWPWIPEAFDEAKRRDVPVHLSIGYAACHWCHVMARESFSDPQTAELLNRDFVSIKVDREERPEVDQVYMRALHALGEQGGWPLTMFLTPDAEPFWGGTYFPPEPRWGRPSFRQILGAVAAAWKGRDAAVTQNAAALREHLNRRPSQAAGPLDPSSLDRAATTLLSIWDMQGGSFQGAPKFPNAPVLDVLWRAYLRTANRDCRSAVLTTLTFLCQGGIYDHVGGGFSRYSVDASWKVPHFEKMLYDNGLLLSLLTYAYRDTRAELFRARIDETVDWLIREMQLSGGGFAASLDADTEHKEGLTYVWDWAELSEILGPDPSFAAVYDAVPGGNWEGKIILNRLSARAWLGDEAEASLAAARARLLHRRTSRPQPGQDDKVLADWNGLAISGLVQAARATNNGAARDAALAAFRFVAESMSVGGRLSHSATRAAAIPGLATDYANMIRAALDLFALEGERRYLDQAEIWFAAAERRHFDSESSAYRLAADDAPRLIAEAMSVTDEATPAATGVMAANAAVLFTLTGEERYRAHGQAILTRSAGRLAEDVVGSASLQSAYDTMLRSRLAVISGDRSEPLIEAALAEPDPALIISTSPAEAIKPGHPAAGKRPTKGASALFLCDALRCLPELATPAEATKALLETRRGLA